MSPGSVHASGNEGGLWRVLVHPFDYAVGFGVVGCRMVILGTKELLERGPEERSEGGTPVEVMCSGMPNQENPCREEGGGARGR